MTRTLRPLSLGKLLDDTFDIYRKNFVLFVGISAVPNLALLLLQVGLGAFIGIGPKSTGIAQVFAGLGVIFASMFVGSLVTAATTFGVSNVYLDLPTGIMACFAHVAGKAVRVFYVSFVVGLMVGLGSLLCFIPGIYLAGKYGLAIPAAVLENITGSQALSRSAELTRNSIGRVIVVYFLTTVFAIGMVITLDAGVAALGSTRPAAGFLNGKAFQEVISTLVWCI